MHNSDAINLAQKLIKCKSITPKEAGALDLLQKILGELGFVCKRYKFGQVDNLYARFGTQSPNFCYAGHVDVVPVGNTDDWQYPPFNAKISGGKLWGRGASDMKGSIAAFIACLSNLFAKGWRPAGSISLLITCDEEGPAINGTKKLLHAISKNGEKIDHCIVGEPTNPERLGEMIKIGRRGSLNGVITVSGKQGHVAYPDLANNPVPCLLKILTALSQKKLDNGNKHFQPSNLEITSIDVNNPAHNVIAKSATAKFNIRFNTEHSGDDLVKWIEDEIDQAQMTFNGKITADIKLPGLPFLTKPCMLTDILKHAIKQVTGIEPTLSTSGGTSDARFITNYCPVVEFGLIGKTIHQINEYAKIEDINMLADIYKTFLQNYFNEAF